MGKIKKQANWTGKGFRRYPEVDLALEVGDLAVRTAAAGVKAVAGKVRTWRNYRPPRWKLSACPSPEEVLAQWRRVKERRGTLEALRFGAMLLNVTQDVDSSPIYGRGKHIVARNPGVKGWLREGCPTINYVTAMSYRKLAEIVCQAIARPEFLPLEWVLPGTEALDASRQLNPERKIGPALKRQEFLRQIRRCRQALEKLLKGTESVNQLFARLDVLTQGHRHRVRRKMAESAILANPAEGLKVKLQSALRTLEVLPLDGLIADKDVLLELLVDLKRRIERPCA